MATIIEESRAVRTVMMLDSLRLVFASDAELARALDIDPAQISRWRRGQEPSEPAWDRLVDLYAVVAKLEDVFKAQRLRKWLGGLNAHLGDRSPLHVLRQGRADEVFAAIQATKASAYA